MRKVGIRILLLSCLLLLSSLTVQAQTNLLNNGSLEEDSFGAYTTRRGGLKPIYVPPAWNYWIAPQSGDFVNKADDITVWPHPGPYPDPVDGKRALIVDCAWITCTLAIYQQFSVQPSSNIQASAWAQVKACNFVEPATSCGSAVESGSQTRIGIDPNGGTDPNDADIVWSGWAQPHDQWKEMTVSATTSGSTATIFLYNAQASKARLNKTYWDKAVVTGGGAGGAVAAAATAVPTPIPYVNFVAPQAAQADGSIVHTIQSGDTLDSIAVAYGVTRQQILDLNNISNPRIIGIGQKLIIKTPEPGAGAEDTGSDTAPAETTAEAAAETPPDAAPETTSEPASEPTAEPVQIVPDSSGANGEAPEPPAADQPPVETPAPPLPTAIQGTAPVTQVAANRFDPAATTASICVLLFEDANQNRIQEQGEEPLAGGKVSINSGGQTTDSYETEASSEPHCFEDLAAGEFVASASAPSGYGLTTPDQLQLRLYPGTTINVVFGAAEGVQAVAPPPADAGGLVSETVGEETDTASLSDQLMNMSGLLVFGLAALVLLGGLGLTLIMRRR